MQLVMRCDDFGYTPVFNLGLKKVLEHGICTHVELMSDTPGNIDAMETMRKYPWVSVGWHQHFRGKPVLPAEQVPSLVNEKGQFKFREVWTKETFNEEARRKKFEGVNYDEMVAELRAELDLFLKYMGRVPDMAGARPGNVAGDATIQVCEEYGIPYQCSRRVGPDGRISEPMEKWKHVKMTTIHQPGHPVYLVRTNEDSYIRNCTYDPLTYVLNDEQHVLDLECGCMAWHPGFYDDYMFEDATYFFDGDKRYFEPSPLVDCAMLCDPRLRQWIKDNKVELLSAADAIHGTRNYQNHLRSIGSDLYIGSILA